MQDYKISFVEQISKEINAKMDAGLKEYATSHGIHVDWKPFALELFDEKNEVIGVLEAFSSYSSIYSDPQFLTLKDRKTTHQAAF